MQELHALLARADESELGRLCRAGLVGLSAALQEALDRGGASGDPAVEECRRALVAIDDVLGRPAVSEAAAGERSVPLGRSDAAPSGAAETSLTTVVAAMTADPAVRPYLSDIATDTATTGSIRADAGAVWRRLRLFLLRLPPGPADFWAAALAECVPSPRDGAAAVWLTGAPASDGWATDAGPAGPLDDDVRVSLRLDTAPPPAAEDLARLVSLVIAVVAVDDGLHLGLERLQRSGLALLDETRRDRWRKDVLSRLDTYADATDEPARAFLALVELDEAVNSLLHLPVAAPDSWWSRLTGRLRALVEDEIRRLRDGGADVEVLPLTLRYLELVRGTRTKGNDLPLDGGTRAPGEVIACLRMWARSENRQWPGRVAYRA